MPGVPYPFHGTIQDSDENALGALRVVLTNVNTNDELTGTTNSSGEFMFDLANLSKGYSDGDQISVYASYGRYYDEIYYTVDVSVSYASDQDLTLDHVISPSAVYCSIQEVRDFTRAGSAEWSDDAIYGMMKRATNLIDERTGRTWKGVQTKTDEYYDGDDTARLWFNKTDIQSISAVAIDNDADGVYTSLIVDDDIFLKHKSYMLINSINAGITSFRAGANTVKVTYTWGNERATESVKLLCMLLVSNWINLDRTRAEEIERLMQELKWKVVGGPQ